MLRNSQEDKKTAKERQENNEIAVEKVRTKDIKELKTLDELMKEKR